jgi:hypothetical protein
MPSRANQEYDLSPVKVTAKKMPTATQKGIGAGLAAAASAMSSMSSKDNGIDESQIPQVSEAARQGRVGQR